MPSSKRPRACSALRKAVLYCSDCGHESPIGGNWLVQVYDEYIDYECPECGTTITSRLK